MIIGSNKVFVCVLALAIAQCEAGNIGIISAVAAGNLQSHSVGHSYSAPQQSQDAGYSYAAVPAISQIPIPSYSSGPLQQETKVVKIVEDHGHANVVAPQPSPHQHVKHIKVHQGLQSYPDHGYYSSPASPQYFKILKITHQESQVVASDGQPQHIQVIRVHHDNHGHDHSASMTTPIVQQKQASTQPIKIIKVIHNHGPISAHNQIAQPIIQNDQNQAFQPVKVIKVYHDNGPVNAAAAVTAPIESGWVSAAAPLAGW